MCGRTSRVAIIYMELLSVIKIFHQIVIVLNISSPPFGDNIAILSIQNTGRAIEIGLRI